MARATYGPEIKKRSMRLLEAIVGLAVGELEGCDRVKVKCTWVEDDDLLRVKTTLLALGALTGCDGGAALTTEQVSECLNRMKDFVGILEDERGAKQGSGDWQFTLRLWGRETAENLRRFEMEWEARRSPKSKEVTAEAQAKRSLPDALRDYVWVETQLERAKLQITKGKIPLDFFDGAEATWLDMVAGHDVVRDVQTEILETVRQWSDRGDRMSMALIQGRSGDGKSTVLRRVATELVAQDYAVLWYRGHASFNREALESLAEDQDLIVCVDDLTKVLPEEIERTLRDLQDISARVFWVVTVRDDLWGGMNLALRQVVKLSEFSVRQLSDPEIGGLLDRLDSYGALGMLAGLGRGEQERRLRDGADRQLLVALLEAKYNESLREYVLRNLYEIEQRFGKVVADACKLACAVQRFGLELPIEYMQEILGVVSPRGDIFSKTEGFLYPPSSVNGHDGVHVRHGVIASIVFEDDQSAYERLSQIVEVDLRSNNKWNRLTPVLCHTIRLQMRNRQLDLDQVRQVFKPASEDLDIRKYVLNIWAILEKQSGNIDQARSLFEKGTQADPKDAPVWQAWALMERDQGNIDQARSLFEKGTQADPKHAPSWQAWALMERDQGNIDQARSLFEKGTQADPKNAPSWQAWALMERDQGNIDQARSLFKRGTTENPTNKTCRGSWRDFEEEQNQPEHLRNFHQHMAILFPKDVKSWQSWATFERTQGESTSARKFYKEAIKINPRNTPSWQAWAIMEKELGNYPISQELFKKATEINPHRPENWQAWALMEKELGHPIKARKLFQSATEADPKAAAAWQAWSILELEQNNLDQGLILAEKAVQCLPKGIYPRLARGQIHQAIGNTKQAISDLDYVCYQLQRSLKTKPNNNRDLNLLARAFTCLGKYAKAEELLKRSLQVSSDQQKPYAHNGLGELYAAQEKREEAIEQWEKALELSPHYLPAKNSLKRFQQ
jgi:tetratricopeptide (TPR) repeat protein